MKRSCIVRKKVSLCQSVSSASRPTRRIGMKTTLCSCGQPSRRASRVQACPYQSAAPLLHGGKARVPRQLAKVRAVPLKGACGRPIGAASPTDDGSRTKRRRAGLDESVVTDAFGAGRQPPKAMLPHAVWSLWAHPRMRDLKRPEETTVRRLRLSAALPGGSLSHAAAGGG